MATTTQVPAARFVAYYRASTKRQGISGLGLGAQRDAVQRHLAERGGRLLDEVTEVESGKRADRPGLAQALTECRLRGATLIVAKLDRLSRNLAFIAKLIEGNVPVVAADAPDAPVLNLQMLAMIAQWEREMISKRTKEALARSTKKLGGNRENLTRSAIKRGAKTSAARRKAKAAARAGDVMNKIDGLRREGASSLREIAAALNAKEIAAPRGGAWSATQVMRVIERTSQEQAR